MALCFAAVAQQYKWVDQNGRTQYGDNPPPGVKATPLRAPAGPAPSAASKGAPTAAEKDADFRRRQAAASKERDKQATAAQDAEAKQRNCAQAREALSILEMGRVRRIDAKGEFYFMDDEQIAQEKAQAQKHVAEWCN